MVHNVQAHHSCSIQRVYQGSILYTGFLDFNLSITNGIVSSKIYDKRDDFNFEIVNFPFFDGDFPRSPSYGVYFSQLIRFARVCSKFDDFNNRNLFLTAKLLKQGYRYHKIRKAFSKFYYRHSKLIVKYNIGLKTLLQQAISEPIFYGDLVYKFKRIVGKPDFSDQFKRIVKRYIRVGCSLDAARQSACLVLNPVAVYGCGFFFGCTTVGRASGSVAALAWSFGRWVGAWCLSVAGPAVARLGVFFGSDCL